MRFPLAGLLLLLTSVPTAAWGQGRRIGGVSIERFYLDGYRFFAVDYRYTEIQKATTGAGIDLAVGMVPDALGSNILLLPIDAGLARALPAGPVTLLLKGGVGNFLALGSGAETSIILGVQGGLGAILPLEKRARIRIDLTRHWYLTTDDPISMWSLGLGLAVIGL